MVILILGILGLQLLWDQRCETKRPIIEWDKTADFGKRTEPPILESVQNRRFWKGYRTANFENETKPPILEWDKTADL